MDTLDEIPATHGVEFVGPWGGGEYRVTIDGYRLPKVVAYLTGEDQWSLTLDERFGLDATHEECQRWLPWLANAMAIGGGYSCFGKNSQEANPYQLRMIGLSSGEDPEFSPSPHEE